VKTYIVKIYRQLPDSSRNTVGIVEEVGISGKRAFNTFDELWEIVNTSHQEKRVAMRSHRPSDGEKRRHRRSEASYLTGYLMELQPEYTTSKGVIANISKSGVCLLTPTALTEGENIVLKRDASSPAQKAAVRWCRQYKNFHYRAGLEFRY
jgi:hypothetical protein